MTLIVRLDETRSEVLEPRTETVAMNVPGWSKSCVAEQVPRLLETAIDSPSPNLKTHVSGPAPPLYVTANVRICSGPVPVDELVKLLTVNGGLENV